MTEDAYRPIACADYDIYEIALMKNKSLVLAWVDSSGREQQHIVKPINLSIVNRAEYLLIEFMGAEQSIRLDRILSASIQE